MERIVQITATGMLLYALTEHGRVYERYCGNDSQAPQGDNRWVLLENVPSTSIKNIEHKGYGS